MQDNFDNIPGFWDKCEQSGLCKELIKNQGNLGVLGVCFDVNYNKDELIYLSAIEKSEDILNANKYDLVEEVITASTWAVFEITGKMPESIHKLWQRIFSEWFPGTGYKYAKKPDFEAYYLSNIKNLEGRAEIWISIES